MLEQEQPPLDFAEAVVPKWENRGGFVYVNGERAQGGYNVRGIAVRESYTALCQRCGKSAINKPLVLWKRFEHALGRVMYWFGCKPGDTTSDFCSECVAGYPELVEANKR